MMTSKQQSYIIHVDGDNFFVACELLMRPDLRGKPVITGYERGIASAMSAEAKRLGITRGMPVFKIKKQFPEVAILHSQYGLYRHYAEKMLAIARRFSLCVHDYSIDECFLDISDKARTFAEAVIIAQNLKTTLKAETGITFSVGLAPTKVLAKIASKHQKPDGFTAIHPALIENFLHDVKIGDVWGIGKSGEKKLAALGITTACDFAALSRAYVLAHFAKPYHDLWDEMHGIPALDTNEETEAQKSIQATRTFPKLSNEKAYVFSHLMRNVEIACARLRDQKMMARQISIFIKDADFHYHGAAAHLHGASAYPIAMLADIRTLFDSLWNNRKTYRSTGITCFDLVEAANTQGALFRDIFEQKPLYDAVDSIRHTFGEYAIVSAESMRSIVSFQDTAKKIRIKSKEFPLPFLGTVS